MIPILGRTSEREPEIRPSKPPMRDREVVKIGNIIVALSRWEMNPEHARLRLIDVGLTEPEATRLVQCAQRNLKVVT